MLPCINVHKLSEVLQPFIFLFTDCQDLSDSSTSESRSVPVSVRDALNKKVSEVYLYNMQQCGHVAQSGKKSKFPSCHVT